ncbi:MAG: ATP-binding protein [Flavobacteriales bacterium]|nr:ATP-binding protein [Flavobacteriales bacterium]
MHQCRYLPLLLVFALSCLAKVTASASVADGNDSIRSTLEGTVSNNQRAQALVSSANRVMNNDPVEAHRFAHNALAFAEQSGDPLVEHKALVALAEAEERVGLFADHMKTTLRAVQLAQSLGDPKMIALDLRELSEAYRLNAMSDKAVEEARNALAMTLPTQTGSAVDEAHRFLIRTLLHGTEFEEAHESAERCLQRAQDKGDVMEEARLSRLIGAVLMAQKEYNDAHPYLVRAERALVKAGTANEQFEILADLAQCSMGMGRYKEAASNLQLAGTAVLVTDTWNNRYRYIELQYQLALAQGRWEEALELLKRIKERSDSVNMARLDMQMARLQMSYQLDRKEKANAELRTENARSAELIAGEKWNNRILLGMLVLLSVLAVALFFTSRHSLRLVRRMALKNAVIKKQHDEIHAKNLELQRQNLRLAETLMSEEEKEMMIKEIHHRVKNNLQVVDSLLQIQSVDSKDPGVDKVLREAQGRIRSMALVHEHIYRSAGGGKGDMQQHITQLVRNILVAHGAHDRISVSVDAPLPTFHADTLMPLTLVVNELFTNAVKYAFRERSSGRVSIIVRPAGTAYELLFSDDGAGMDAEEGLGRERSFGLELVGMLAEQLNGEVRFLKGSGTTVSLTFMPDPVPLRVAS